MGLVQSPMWRRADGRPGSTRCWYDHGRPRWTATSRRRPGAPAAHPQQPRSWNQQNTTRRNGSTLTSAGTRSDPASRSTHRRPGMVGRGTRDRADIRLTEIERGERQRAGRRTRADPGERRRGSGRGRSDGRARDQSTGTLAP